MPTPAHLRTEPIVVSDDEVEDLLGDTSTVALVASVVHLTGDPSILRRDVRPRQFSLRDFQGGLDEEEQAVLRAHASEAIAAWRDAGCPPPAPLDVTIVRELMDWVACEPMPDDCAALYFDEMDLAGEDPRAIRLENVAPEGFSALIIGCGESGLLAAIRLQEAGIAFGILEKNHDVGGTWLENTYPGCRVDVASHYYSYSFGPNDEFSEYYAQQPELYAYFRRLLDERGIAEQVSWGCEVERAVWDEDEARWHVTSVGSDGTRETRSANVLISGVGILNRPLYPDLPGLDRFAGPVFHSARWDHDVDLRGKKVALVGAGASGFQIGPAIVDDVERLAVFQRTPQWMAPNRRYHDAVKPGERWAMRHLPGYARWYRFMLMWMSNDRLLEVIRIDPDWHDLPRTANEENAAMRASFARYIEKLVGDDTDLLAKVVPEYPPMSKRMLQDNGSWLQCLLQPHVDLVRDAILEIDEKGITTGEGHHDVDVIVLATGFRASEVLWPMEIVGRDGCSITDVWDGGPTAYLGTTVPGFPNLFVLTGPGTGLAHAGSVILMSECQMRYVGDALRTLIDGGHRTIEPTREAHDRYNEALQTEVGEMMWGHPSIEHSWYKAADGKVYVLCPWRIVDYWAMTSRAEPDDHLVG